MSTRQLILDTETTGFEPRDGHRIIEFAALEMIDRKLTGNKLHLYFNPLRDIPEAASKVHGITLEQLKDKPLFVDKVEEIIDFISGAELIIHNAKFDLNFLDHHFGELGKLTTLNYAIKSIDTLYLARQKFQGAKNSLDALCDRFKVNRLNRQYHGALIDCELLSFVYLELTKEQISLLVDEKNSNTNQAHVFREIKLEATDLVAVALSPEELTANLLYLQQLEKESKGNSLWYHRLTKVEGMGGD